MIYKKVREDEREHTSTYTLLYLPLKRILENFTHATIFIQKQPKTNKNCFLGGVGGGFVEEVALPSLK